MTHSFHCCAFKYPARHDPAYYAERQKLKAMVQKQCSESSTKNDHAVTHSTLNIDDGWGESVDLWGQAVETDMKPSPRLLVKRAIEEELNHKYTPKM